MSSPENKTVLLLEDHFIVRQACCSLLEQEGFNVLWQGTNGDEAYEAYISLKPDIVIIDISVEGKSGLDVIELIKNRDDNAKIIVFSMHNDAIFISHTINLGVLGYVTKSCNPAELVSAIKSASKGKPYLSSDITINIEKQDLLNNHDLLSTLTAQERKIYMLSIQGKSSINISKTLSISTKSVSNHLFNIKQKLGAKTMSDLVRIAINYGIPVKTPD